MNVYALSLRASPSWAPCQALTIIAPVLRPVSPTTAPFARDITKYGGPCTSANGLADPLPRGTRPRNPMATDGQASDGSSGTDADCPLRQDAITQVGWPHGGGCPAHGDIPGYDHRF